MYISPQKKVSPTNFDVEDLDKSLHATRVFSPMSLNASLKKKPFLPTVDKLDDDQDDVDKLKLPTIVASGERIENVTP